MAESNEGDAGNAPTLGEHQLERSVCGSVGDKAVIVYTADQIFILQGEMHCVPE